jgi:hypothetical protein
MLPAMASTPPQPTREPDALEILRRDRGEGWQWHRIQMDACPQCGYHPAALPPSVLGDVVVQKASDWRQFLVHSDDTYLRTSPEPGVFSPMQYGAHVRGMLMVAGDRMLLGIEQNDPVVPIFNPPQEEWESYNSLDSEQLAADIETQARRLAEIIGGLDESGFSRTIINDRGIYGIYSFTLAGLGCNAAHEAHHHLLDAKGTLNLEASS